MIKRGEGVEDESCSSPSRGLPLLYDNAPALKRGKRVAVIDHPGDPLSALFNAPRHTQSRQPASRGGRGVRGLRSGSGRIAAGRGCHGSGGSKISAQ